MIPNSLLVEKCIALHLYNPFHCIVIVIVIVIVCIAMKWIVQMEDEMNVQHSNKI